MKRKIFNYLAISFLAITAACSSKAIRESQGTNGADTSSANVLQLGEGGDLHHKC